MIKTRGLASKDDYFHAGFVQGTEISAAIISMAITRMRGRLMMCFVPGDVATANHLLDEVEETLIKHLVEATQ